jgi:cytoskeleton protein RodZ
MNEFEAAPATDRNDGLPEAPLRLRQAREAAGLHIAALAAALKVPVKKLEALEAGRYDELPDMTFARALASSACRQLKVDPAAVLEQIPGAIRQPLGASRTRINEPFKSGDEIGGSGAMAWLARPVVWGAGLLLLAAIAVVLAPQDWVSRFERATATSPEPMATTPLSAIEPLVPAAPDGSLSAVEPLPLSGEVATSSASLGAASETLPEASVAPAAEMQSLASADGPSPVVAGSGLLSIRAVNESWIEVVNGSGVQVVQRVLKPDEVLEFSTAPPYSVVVGRADAVQVTVRGQPFDVMPYARNSVARFEVK